MNPVETAKKIITEYPKPSSIEFGPYLVALAFLRAIEVVEFYGQGNEWDYGDKAREFLASLTTENE